AGCAAHSMDTRVPSTDPIAHSTCGHSARGAECTKTTPRVLTPDATAGIAAPSDSVEIRLPLRISPGAVQRRPRLVAAIVPYRAGSGHSPGVRRARTGTWPARARGAVTGRRAPSGRTGSRR